MVEVVATPTRVGTSYVEWGPVFAGALIASAISFVLLTAGGAIGLSLISPYAHQSSPRVAASIAVFWSIAVPILAFLIGGYIAGRMRSAWGEASREEVKFRDGMHGALVWALSIVAGAMLAFSAAGGAASGGAQVAAAAGDQNSPAVAPAIDSLFAAAPAAPAEGAHPGAAASAAPPTGERATAPESEARAMIARTLVAAAAAGELTPAQKRTIAQIVSERTGISEADVATRVDQAFKDGQAAIDKARKALVATGLVTATALLVGLLAAWFAAQNGGRHRDQNIPARLILSFMGSDRRSPLR